MKIAVILLHHCNLTDTLECLESLNRQDYPHFEIIFVDNGSQNPNIEDAIKQSSKLLFIKNETNLGFAEGNNIAIRLALERGANAVLLLNNDTVCSPHLLTTFAAAAQTYPDAAVLGAKIFFYDDPTTLWHAGGNVNPITLRCYHEGCPSSDGEKKWENVRDISYACGCALFVTSNAIKDVGLMAPEFFLLWEEIDWCWRIRKAGYRCLFIPEAKVWHKISQTFKGGYRGPQWQYYYFRNRLLFLKRNFPLSKRTHFYLTLFLKELLEIIFFSCSQKATHNQRKLNRAALKGIIHYHFRRFNQE
jgi:GT2 family glycosyltransferase